MKYSLTFVGTAAVLASVVSAVDPNLVPQFGVNAGTNPTGTGDCDGINGVKIPCSCPPDRNSFIDSLNANVAAGHAVNNPGVALSFPTGNTGFEQAARITASIITLQNLHGPGVGCPAAATTFSAQLSAAQAAGNGPAPGAPAPPPPPPPAAAPAPAPAPAPAGGVDPNLVPQLGVNAGTNPTGTGDCDGINGIKIPCSCPPDRNSFIQSLSANVAAGHAVNNPGVSVSFPTGNSGADQAARITASLITLQNLHGPGVGCPASSTTFSAQLAAAQRLGRRGNVKTRAVKESLIPQLGFKAGVNPTGTGDCDGAVKGANGLPIKIPCSCPPDRKTFVAAVNANVAAGHAVNNPSIKVSFPTGNSISDKAARINTALVTLQNLHGPGVGCPAVSTTLQAQQKALGRRETMKRRMAYD